MKQGQMGDFWKLIVKAITMSIDKLRSDTKDLRGLPADEYKLENELILAKIDYLNHLIGLPDILIANGEPAEKISETNFDPYMGTVTK